MIKKLEALMFLFFILFISLIIISPKINLPQINILTISQVFNNFAVGVGGILAGLAGLKYLNEILGRKRKMEQESHLKLTYPVTNLNRSFKLINRPNNVNWIYLHDLNTNKKHHIASDWTFTSLGYDRTMVQTINDQVFNAIEEGNMFLTRGAFGS